MLLRSHVVVAPQSFGVAPEILDRPLAHPGRRLAAFLIDSAIVGVLSLASWTVLALVAAFALVRAARQRASSGRTGRFGRVPAWFALGAAAALIVFAVLALVARFGESNVTIGAGDTRTEMTPGEAMGIFGGVLSLKNSKTEDERRAAADALVKLASSQSENKLKARALVEGLASEMDDDVQQQALEDALDASPLGAVALRPDPALVRRYADALAADPAAAEALRPDVAVAVAAPELAAQSHAADEARKRAAELETRVRKLERPRGFRGLLAGVADDLGLGLGWTIVYFTILTAAWNGRTLGKRLMRCRVVRLDGKPLTWWGSFERAGGYAASAAIGLMGFAEILWDLNRQALHDKVSRTVVLRDP